MVWGVANHLSTRSLFLTACVLAAGVPMRAMALGRCGPAPYVPECNKAICSSDTGGWDLLPLAYGTSCNGGAGICDGDGSCMIAYGQFKSGPIYVHGISPVGTTNGLLSNSGAIKLPDGAVVGNSDGIFPTASDAQHIPGWACAHGVAGSINVHLYAGGPAGSGTFVTAATANLASEPDVASACKLDGATALRFDIPISAALNYQL